jgi:hypothetical protein
LLGGEGVVEDHKEPLASSDTPEQCGTLFYGLRQWVTLKAHGPDRLAESFLWT